MSSSPQELPAGVLGGERPRGLPPTLTLALLALLPILAMSFVGWRFGPALQELITVDLTNASVLRRVAATFFTPSTHADSWWPMRQALEVLQGPNRDALYETLFFADGVRFQYPPTSLLPIEVLTWLGLGSARALNALNSLMLALNAAALGALALVIFRRSDAASRGWPDPRGMAVLAAACAFLFYPLIRAHVLGQIQLWIDLLFTAAVLLWVLERRILAGVMVGLACAIKPQLGLVVVWALLWRQMGFVAGAAAALAPIGLISLARYGLHNHLEYLEVLSFLSHRGESFFANNSVNGILNGYLSPENTLRWNADGFPPFHPVVYAGTLAATLVFYGAVLASPLLARGRQPGVADFGAAAILTVIGSPVAWEHHYGLLAPVFLVALHRALRLRDTGGGTLALWLVLAAWTLVANFIPFTALLAGTAASIIQAYAFFGALLLLACLILQPRGRGAT